MVRGFSCIGLYNPKTDANVGGALRAASCYSVSMVSIQGIRYQRTSSDTTVAYRHIPMIHTESLIDSVPFDCIPIGIELNHKAKDIRTFQHPERAFYIFGPEDGSIPENVLDRCKFILKINTKVCMNLAATVNVVLYDRHLKRNE